MSQTYQYSDPAADTLLRRIRALGYDVRTSVWHEGGTGVGRLTLSAADSRTGERHVVNAALSGSKCELEWVSELAALIASEMEG